MFGYATDETETLMPLTHNLATSLGAKLTEVGAHERQDGPYLGQAPIYHNLTLICCHYLS